MLKIGNNVFIGVGSIVLPNKRMGNTVIIGSGSIVTKDNLDKSIVAGNPCKYDEYINKHRDLIVYVTTINI